jgi:UDP-glucose 4-epimerase
MNVGVTGATGFLGSSLLRQLRSSSGVKVVALTRTLPAEPIDDDIRWVRGDLVSPVDCAAFVSDLDVVVHLAGTNTPLTSSVDLPTDVAANLIPMVTLLQALRNRGGRPHFVFASSGGAVYAPPARPDPLPETAEVGPSSSYGVQKLASEIYLRMAAELGWVTASVLRIGNPYGVLLPPERLQGFIGVALNQVRKETPIRLFGDTRNVRDYVHLDDVNQMFELVLQDRREFEIFNVGSGVGHSVDDVLEIVERVLGRPLDVRREAVAGDEEHLPSWVVLDVGKAERLLGWRPSISLSAGIERLAASPTWRGA